MDNNNVTFNEIKELIKSEVLELEYCLYDTNINANIARGLGDNVSITGKIYILDFIDKFLSTKLTVREKQLIKYLYRNDILNCLEFTVTTNQDINFILATFDPDTIYYYYHVDKTHQRVYKFFSKTILKIKHLILVELQALPVKIYNTLLPYTYED